MLIAQSLGEYGSLAAIAQSISNGFQILESQVRDLEPTTWAFIIAGGVILWLALGGRR